MRSDPMLREDALRLGEKDMALPEGKYCRDCIFFYRCRMIYGHIAEDEVCDWSPSQFLEVKEQVA